MCGLLFMTCLDVPERSPVAQCNPYMYGFVIHKADNGLLVSDPGVSREGLTNEILG